MTVTQKFIVADDHPLFRAALTQALKNIAQGQIIEADSMDTTINATEQHPDADLIFLDLHMPGANGFSGLIKLRGHVPEIPVIVISASDEASVIRRAIKFGASGFIPKSASLDIIAEAISEVLNGEIWIPANTLEQLGEEDQQEARFAGAIASLTPQQFRVLTMLTDGLLNKQIAYELNVSEATIKAHVTAILRKLNVHSRTQAVIAAQHFEIETAKIDLQAPQVINNILNKTAISV